MKKNGWRIQIISAKLLLQPKEKKVDKNLSILTGKKGQRGKIPVFLFDTFLGVALSESRYIFCLRTFSESFDIFYPFCLSIRLIYYVVFVPLFCCQIVLFPCHPVVGMSSGIPSLQSGRIFIHCFEMSCFVSLQSRYLFRLSPLATTFHFISSCCIVCFNCCVSLFVPTYSIVFPMSYQFCLLW